MNFSTQIPISMPELNFSIWDICVCILAICGLLAIIFLLLILFRIKRAKERLEEAKQRLFSSKEVILRKCPVCGNFYDEKNFCEKCGYKKR